MRISDWSSDVCSSDLDEPYRRALTGIYARLAATFTHFTGKPAPRHVTHEGTPYATPAELRADLVAIAHGLGGSGGGQPGSGGALGRLIRAAEAFAFHLAVSAMRQHLAVLKRGLPEI